MQHWCMGTRLLDRRLLDSKLLDCRRRGNRNARRSRNVAACERAAAVHEGCCP